ncbi:hypothetical protein [Duganella sp.]|uniref:hypothetical protein n=1 Tax=Duganella sp. TaxID=1904440 RepID=UPI0031DC491E
MPQGAQLTNIAIGLCGSFTSRNNDLDGYWSIGKLRSLADRHGRTAVVLDLLTSSIHPSSSEFATVLARYRHLLAKLAGLSRIRLEDITVAHIALDFAPAPWPRISYYKPQWGDQFTVAVTINADGRAAGIAHHGGYCRAHDPVRECRSARP